MGARLSPQIKLLKGALRLSNQVGSLLIFLPGLWGLAVMPKTLTPPSFFVFLLGCFWARSLGCLYNDWIDQAYDGKVPRTQHRPFVNHKPMAFFWVCVGVLVAVPGLIFLWLLPLPSLTLGVIGIGGSLLYPFLKRFFFAPQLFLGLLFNLGIFMAPSLSLGRIPFTSTLLLLYGAGILWTLEYDTVYAYQDRKDDLKLGLLSLAVVLKNYGRAFLLVVQGLRYGLLFCLVNPKARLCCVLIWLVWISFLWTLDLEDPSQCGSSFKRTVLEGFLWAVILFFSFS